MSDFDLLKPIKAEFFAKLLVQILIGIAFTLVLASWIKPMTVDIPESNYAPIFVERVLLMVYNSMILVATESAKLIVPIALLYGVSTMGYIGMKTIEFVGEHLLILFKMIEKEKTETEDAQ